MGLESSAVWSSLVWAWSLQQSGPVWYGQSSAVWFWLVWAVFSRLCASPSRHMCCWNGRKYPVLRRKRWCMVPRACSTLLQFCPIFREAGLRQQRPPWSNTARTAVGQDLLKTMTVMQSAGLWLSCKTLVISFILSGLDYCNCLLVGVPTSVIQPLQKIQNFAAGVVLLAPRHYHSTPLLEKTTLAAHFRMY